MRCCAVVLAWAALVAAAPTPAQPLRLEQRRVPTPTQPLRLEQRDIAASITAYVASALQSEAAGLSLPPASGVLGQFSIPSSSVAAQPTHFLNLRGYANWSTANSQWTGRVHGLLYKIPPLTTDQANIAADVFVPDAEVSQLPASCVDDVAQAQLTATAKPSKRAI